MNRNTCPRSIWPKNIVRHRLLQRLCQRSAVQLGETSKNIETVVWQAEKSWDHSPTYRFLLGANRMEFLGHQIGGDVITPTGVNLDNLAAVGLLLQENEVKLYPGGYASKKFSLVEGEYRSWRCFKLHLAGIRFTLQTDHKPLKSLKDAAYQKDRVLRWAIAVQEYSFHVEDIPGKKNIGAYFWCRTGCSC